jgi:hypothetical protein
MSAPRRNQAHDRLGRFTHRLAHRLTHRLTRRRGLAGAKPAGRPARAWRRALALTLAALHSELARRLGRLALVGGALAGVVVVLYQHGEAPAALARPAQATVTTPPTRAGGSAPAAPATTAGGASSRGAPGGGSAPAVPGAPTVPGASTTPGASDAPGASGAPGAPARRAKAFRPADVATAWYAARRHLPISKVQALQQDVLSEREVRILVIADRGKGRLDTALVTVRRGAGGEWSVP